MTRDLFFELGFFLGFFRGGLTHLSDGDSSGFITADVGDSGKRLDGVHPPNESVLSSELSTRCGEGERDDGDERGGKN